MKLHEFVDPSCQMQSTVWVDLDKVEAISRGHGDSTQLHLVSGRSVTVDTPADEVIHMMRSS